MAAALEFAGMRAGASSEPGIKGGVMTRGERERERESPFPNGGTRYGDEIDEERGNRRNQTGFWLLFSALAYLWWDPRCLLGGMPVLMCT